MKIFEVLKDKQNAQMNKINKAKEKVDDKKKDLQETVNKAKKLTVMDIFEEFIDIILNTLKFSINDIMIVPGKQLKEPCTYCAIIAFVSLGCKVFGIPFLTDWKGATLGTVIIGIVLLIGTREELK